VNEPSPAEHSVSVEDIQHGIMCEKGLEVLDPGVEAREHYLSIAEKMSRNSTPCSSARSYKGAKQSPGAAEFDFWEGGADDLGLDWPGDEEITDGDVDAVRAKVRQLREKGIRMLAIDNDLTLISIHTGGHWSGTAEELAEQGRPIFKPLIEEAVAQKIFIAIVTFSSQPELIREMLVHFLEGHEVDTSEIAVFGGLNKPLSGINGQELKAGEKVRARYQGTGKQEHIACAVEGVEQSHDISIAPNQVLMIDDDVKNLQEAKKRGIRAAFFDPMEPLTVLDRIDECLA